MEGGVRQGWVLGEERRWRSWDVGGCYMAFASLPPLLLSVLEADESCRHVYSLFCCLRELAAL